MEKINQFSLQRFILLMRRYITFNNKTWLIGIGAISGVLIVISLIQAYISGGHFDLRSLVNTGQTMIFISGFIITSMAYNEIHTPARSQFYLTLPALTSEKLFSSWLITSVLFIFLANILLAVVLGLANGITNIAWSSNFNMFNPFTIPNLKLMGIYVVVQSIFFLGALQFKKNNFMKTILSLFVIALVIIIIAVLIAYLLFGKDGMHVESQMMTSDLRHNFEVLFPRVMKIIFNLVVVPFCLLVSYFKLKEREV